MAEFPTKRIINLDEQSEPQSGDYIVTDNQTSGTKKTPASALAKAADLAAEQTARQQAIEAEAQARQQADTTLDGKITAEAQARANAIGAEQTAREQADADLKSDLIDGSHDAIACYNGNFTANAIAHSGYPNRLITPTISFKSGDKITIANGTMQHVVGMWQGSVSSANNKRNDSVWISTGETITPNYDGIMVVVFRKSDNSNITVADYDGTVAIYNALTWKNKEAIEVINDNIEWLIPKSVYNSATNTSGYYYNSGLNGNPFAYPGWNITAKIPIKNGYKYKYKGLTIFGNTPCAVYYAGAGGVISTFKPTTGENTLNPPNGATHVAFSVNDADLSTFDCIEQFDPSSWSDNKASLVKCTLQTLPDASKYDFAIENTNKKLLWSDAFCWRYSANDLLAIVAEAYKTVKVADGSLISENKSDELYECYSTTKLLSALVATMYISNYSDTVTLTAEDAPDDYNLFVQPNDVVSYDTLLGSSLVQSDNNAARSLARPIGYIIKPTASSDAEARNAFLAEMERVATEVVGMTDSVYTGMAPFSGLRSTPSDMCKLIAYIQENSPKIKSLWNLLTFTVTVGGDNARTWVIDSTTPSSARTIIPEFGGGKTGSGGGYGTYAFVWEDDDNTIYATMLMNTLTSIPNARFYDARQIIDEAYGIIE